MPMSSRRRRSSHQSYDSDDSDDDDRKPAARGSTQEESSSQVVSFTQLEPELSQRLVPVKDAERSKWNQKSRDAQDKLVTDLTRVILFKAMARQPLDKSKCAQEALGEYAKDRITQAALEQAADRLERIFGYELRRVPAYMEAGLPPKYKDRFFLINGIEDDEGGTHSKAIHSVHAHEAVAKGLLMVVLAFCYCKGERRNDTGARWIRNVDLYRLLNGLDENIPAEPPKGKAQRFSQNNNESTTPNVDWLLEQFVQEDYLLREKEKTDDNVPASQSDEVVYLYSMGPRAAMEIGRKQVICFCAEILDEEPDPAMLAEIDEDDDDGEMVVGDDE